MIDATAHPLTQPARQDGPSAQTVYVLVVPGREPFPAGLAHGQVSVLTARRTDPGEPIYYTAADAVRQHLGRQSPEPLLIGVMPDGEGRLAAVFWVGGDDQC